MTVIPGQGHSQEEPLEAEDHRAEPEPHWVAAVIVIDDLVTQVKSINDGGRKDIDGTKEEPKKMNYAKNIVETLKHFPAVNLSAIVNFIFFYVNDMFLAPSGAQGVTMSVCPWGTKLSKALNLHLSLIGLSKVCLRFVSDLCNFLTYFVVQTEPKILGILKSTFESPTHFSYK